jgi:hypothetical protein
MTDAWTLKSSLLLFNLGIDCILNPGAFAIAESLKVNTFLLNVEGSIIKKKELLHCKSFENKGFVDIAESWRHRAS